MSDKAKPETHTTFPNRFEAFYLVVMLIAVEILVSIGLRESSLLDDIDWQGASGFITVVGNGIVFVFLLTYKQMTYRSLFHASPQSIAGTMAAVMIPILLVVPGLVLLTGALNAVVAWLLPMSRDDIELFRDMMVATVIPLFFACIAAPVLEEMLFRGVILRSFLLQYSRLQSILWSALLFALAHLNAYQFFTALGLGLVGGWLYERMRSLWPSILLHAAFNGFVAFGANTAADLDSFSWFYAGAFVCAIAGGALLLRILEPATRRQNSKGDSGR